MAILTVFEKLNIAALCESYAVVDIKQSGLYGGGVDLQLPRKIYCIRKSIQWLYDINNGDSTLEGTTNYLISLCGKYYLQAAAVIAGGGGGSVTPIRQAQQYPIKVLGSVFAPTDGKTYVNTNIVGDPVMIFIGGYNEEWHFAPTDFIYTATGIQIVIPGFNANNYEYILIQKYST